MQETPADPGIDRVAVQSAPAQSSSLLDQLRATAKAAIDEGNGAMVQSLLPLIEAEQQRLAAEQKRLASSTPVSLELVRAKREGR